MIKITRVTKNIVTINTFEDVDLSAIIPAGATGVLIEIETVSSGLVGFRKNGSTDNRTTTNGGGQHYCVAVGLDVNRIFEAYAAFTTTNFHIVGYYTTDAVFFTNAVDKSYAGSNSAWIDMDISADTGSDTALGAIIERTSTDAVTAYAWGFRNNGSTDDRQIVSSATNRHSCAFVPVDASEICESLKAADDVKFFLLGYFVSNFFGRVNATDMSLVSVNIYVDLTALDSGAIAGVFEIAADGSRTYNLRAKGDTQDVFKGVNRHVWFPSFTDASRIVEAKVSAVGAGIYYWAYHTTVTAGASANSKFFLQG